MQKLESLKRIVSQWEQLEKETKELRELVLLAQQENDQRLIPDLVAQKQDLMKRFRELEKFLFLSGKYDSSNAILTIHAGTGGVEACDWAAMLTHMYLQFAKENSFETKIIDKLAGREAGIKNISLEIRGPFAYGLLKSERGVHRLVRLSPFDADHARHTSFVLVEVVPEVEKDIDVKIKPEELKIETFRSSGPGGQHANVTASAVRITHLPTGIVASCQSERSQIRNKETALKVLKARLLERKLEEEEKKINKLRGSIIEASWGNQIRSYILHPYQLIRDHRTGYETSKVEEVLEGKLMPFIEAYLRWYIANAK